MNKPVRLLLSVLLLPALAAAQIHFSSTLSGSEGGSGSGSFSLNDDFTELKYVIAYQGLTGPLSVGGHFHVAPAGQDGPVVRTIAAAGNPASGILRGTWTISDTQPLTQALVESLLTGKIYVNLHTESNPGGEIRGQLALETALLFTADLNGSQEPNPVQTNGGGTGAFVLSTDFSEMKYSIVYRGLSGTLSAGGHFHTGAPGTNGSVVKNIASAGGDTSDALKDSWRVDDSSQPLSPALVDSLLAGRVYVNFHTAANPGGEIRGQLRLRGGIGFVSWLEGSKEPGGVTTDGKGVGYVVLQSDRTALEYAFTYIDLSGQLSAGGHFHTGSAGTSGPVVKGIAGGGGAASATLAGTWRSDDPTQPLTSALAESLLAGRVYVNFHTSSNPGGEIRDQVGLETGVGFTVELDGSQEPNQVMTSGLGAGSLALNGERQDLRYTITYFGLSGTLSAGGHFHTGARGADGAVVRSIAGSGDPAAATVVGDWSASTPAQPLTEALVESVLAGRVYVNFHTSANPGGEIRGQVEFGADVLASVREVPGDVPAAFALDQNYPNPFNPSTVIRFLLAEQTRARLSVFNLLGQEVAVLVDEVRGAGTHEATFSGDRIASGVYLYRLSTGAGDTQTRRMVLVR
jgi:hypothetical protein